MSKSDRSSQAGTRTAIIAVGILAIAAIALWNTPSIDRGVVAARVKEFLQLGSTLLAAFATAWAAFAAAQAARSARDSIEFGRSASRRELRAYVGVVELELLGPDLNNNAYVPQDSSLAGVTCRNLLGVTVKNFGETPARDVVVYAYWFAVPFPGRLPEGFFGANDTDTVDVNDVRTTTSKFMLDRGQTHLSEIPIWDLTVWKLANNSTLNLYVYGRIYYTDAYGRTRRRFFCSGWIPQSPKAKFIPYQEYNGEDDREGPKPPS